MDLCDRLSDEEKRKVPVSLIKAFRAYVEERGEDPDKPVHADVDNMDNFLAALSQLVLYYSGLASRKEAISDIQENTSSLQRQEIEKILLLKRCFDSTQSGGFI